MTCPRCHCRECRTAIANERLRKFLLSRETPVDLPDDHDAEQLSREIARLHDDLARGVA